MKRMAWLTLFMMALVMAGCTRTETTDVETGAQSGRSMEVREDGTAERMQREASEALDATGDYLQEQKTNIQSEINRSLKEVDNRLTELRRDANQASGEERDKLEIEIRGLEEERAQLREMGQNVQEATSKTLKNLQDGWDRLEVRVETRLKANENQDRTAQ